MKTSAPGKASLGDPKAGSGGKKPPSVPSGTRFLFQIQELRLTPGHTGRMINGQWYPPIEQNAFVSGQRSAYRWSDGNVSAIDLATYPQLSTNRNSANYYRSATVFTQSGPAASDRLLCVNFDPRLESVTTSIPMTEWREIGFQHDQAGGQWNRYYSFVDFAGAHRRLAAAAPTNNTWVDQLFPSRYHWQGGDAGASGTINAGLTGELPLILALCAFSTQIAHVSSHLTQCIHLHRWSRHTGYHGRNNHRGILVTVWHDPDRHTPIQQLNSLARGLYGPFFNPE